MKKTNKLSLIVFFISTFSLLEGCIHSEHYKQTYRTKNCDGLYSNIYDVYWWGVYKEQGAWSLYITDSLSFRVYLGIYNEYDSYGCKIKNDTLYIEKKTTNNFELPTIVESRKYSLKTLKHSQPFKR